MNINDYDYTLSANFIAQEPVSPRDHCRLMLLDRKNGEISHNHFYNILDYLRPDDVLVFNNSKVIPARIRFQSGHKIFEIFLTKKVNKTDWYCIGKPGKALSVNSTFKINSNLNAKVIEVLTDGQRVIRFQAEGDLDSILADAGEAPFPPYIKETKASFSDYQTVYAREDGSVAAPTAGLHFTEELLTKIRSRGIQTLFVTLHVGLGTFLPVKTENIEKHLMHSEFFSIDQKTAEALNKAKVEGRRLIAVGTTAIRVLESNFDPEKGFTAKTGETSIYIYPGYKWKCVDGLITNFHLPKSTLLLLISSFAGKDFVRKAYQTAVNEKYRFYSFGDAMFIQ